MPRLLEKDDVMQTAVNLGRAEKVWSEQLVTGSGDMTFRLPEGGSYQVILLKVSSSSDQESPAKKDPREEHFGCPRPDYSKLIGYGAKFHKPRSTAEWMKELREGEVE